MDPSKLFRENIVSADGTLKYLENISLQNNVLKNIVLSLLMNEKHQFLEAYNLEQNCWGHIEWMEIKNCVLNNVRQLPLPEVIICRLANLTRFLVDELINWIDFHVVKVLQAGRSVGCESIKSNIAEIFINAVHHIKWSNSGRIDAKRTAIILLGETKLEDEQKFVLSCIYCLEEELKKFSFDVIKKYNYAFFYKKLDISNFPMVFYWTYHLKDIWMYNLRELIEGSNMSINECVLNQVTYRFINSKYDDAKKYLWDKLPVAEKSKNISMIVTMVKPTFKYPLMSTLTYEQQKDLFQSGLAVQFLMLMFVDWQWMDCFLPTLYHIIDILRPNQYLYLFERLRLVIEECYKSGDIFCEGECYKSIVRALWENTPINLKEYIFGHCRSVEEFLKMLGCDISIQC